MSNSRYTSQNEHSGNFVDFLSHIVLAFKKILLVFCLNVTVSNLLCFFNFYSYFSLFLFVCLFDFQRERERGRERKCMELGGWGGGEDL